MQFTNLTPHDVQLVLPDPDDPSQTVVVVIPRDLGGRVARLMEEDDPREETVFYSDEDRPRLPIPVRRRRWTRVEGLPPLTSGIGRAGTSTHIGLIVSLPVLQAVGTARHDLYSPDTGAGAVRDADGRIVGTTRLVQAG